MTKKRPCGVLFDYDDTLVQTRQCKYEAIKAVGARYYGVRIECSTIDQHWGIEYRELFRALFSEFDADVDRVIARYEALNGEFPVIDYPDARHALEELFERGIAVGIVTSAGDIVHRQLRELDFPVERLALVQTAMDTPFHKPDPRVFNPALEQLEALGIPRQRVSYVGDSLRDYQAARSAGLSFVGIAGRTTTTQEFMAAGAKVARNLREVTSLGDEPGEGGCNDPRGQGEPSPDPPRHAATIRPRCK